MARRRRRRTASISLLPILSIQKCTMGIMVVIICAQNMVSLGKTTDQFVEMVGAIKDREAVYVECRQKDIIIHPDKTEVGLESLKGTGPSAFHDLLDKLKTEQDKDKNKKYL